jgi:hypothetical protein
LAAPGKHDETGERAGSLTLFKALRGMTYAERTLQSPSRYNLPIHPRACWEYAVELRFSGTCG